MKVLITGVNGLLGQKLLSIFCKNKDCSFDIVAVSRGRARFDGSYKQLKYYDLDITHREQVFNIIHLEKPDVIIHAAAMTNVDYCESHQEDCWEVNVQSVVHMLQAAEAYNSFFVHLSSDFVFAGDKRFLTEEDKPHPINFYGQSKFQAEKFVLKSRVPHAVIRTAVVYGIAHKMSRSNIILWVKRNLEDGKSIRVVDDQYRSPTLAEDLATGCYLIVQKQSTGIYNIAGGEVLTPYEMAIKIADYFGLDKSLITRTDASEFVQPAKRPLETGLVIDKAKFELGYQPHSFDQGVAILASQLDEEYCLTKG
ncbi:MAG: SDR family oxidoreductase [Bacteroidota bacterium]